MYVMDERAVKRDGIHAFARGHKAERLWAFGLRARREEAAGMSGREWILHAGGRFCGGCSKEIMKWKFRDFVSAKTAE